MVQKKKKWSKGKVREKLANMVVFDKATHARLFKEVPKVNQFVLFKLDLYSPKTFLYQMKVITPATVSERLKINGSLARKGLHELVSVGKIKVVSYHHRTKIYTRIVEEEEK